MRCLIAALTLALQALAQQQTVPAQAPLTAEAIMARVAANQDSSEAERAHYIYVQHAHVVSRKGKTVMCEETTDSRVTPSGSGSEQKLLTLDGRLLRKHQYLAYTTLPAKNGDATATKSEKEDFGGEFDRELVESMRKNLTDSNTKDGLGKGLFPLTSKNQQDYQFQLLGREQKNGRDVYHLSFRPKDKDDYNWKGDAYIDAVAYQPVLVRTAMSRRIPFAVRTLLGTSLPGLGFTVIYAPQPDGVWFPVSFGTEFKLHVLFFLNREIAVSAENREFVKTHVSSRIVSGPATPAEPLQ